MVIPHSLFTDFDIHLFRTGKHYRLYEKMGAHEITLDQKKGVYFAVWAPNARFVSVIGSFNKWDRIQDMLYPRPDGSGIWEGFIPGASKGDLYKYLVVSFKSNIEVEKSDPFAFFSEVQPNKASVVWSVDYKWEDKGWLDQRKTESNIKKPVSVYEVHIGSWKRNAQDHRTFLNYRELAAELVPYVQDMGFTHVEFMPVMEHPYYPSWGYQITGFFAPTSRYGTPDDLMFLIDALHQAGIGVILDWVPSHFPQDANGLALFDGTHLYEHEDPRKGFHPEWQSLIFNYGRFEVRSFLLSNAVFWFERFHIDGVRVDAVSSMIHLDYSRKEGEWEPNIHGGRENLEAISLLREMNEVVYGEFPDVFTIAEESTAFPGVSHPTYNGGLGFGQKWMMGWMHDTLKYFKQDPLYRKFHHGQITFSIIYAFSENFMLPLSHDEVVHGKGTLLTRMPGDEWQRFANLRLMFGYMFTHPGTKLLFMGGEFGQTSEWAHAKELDWWLLKYEIHAGVKEWVKTLNHYYRNTPSLFTRQFDPSGFAWVVVDDYENSVVAYLRIGDKKEKPVLVVMNCTPLIRENYTVGVPKAGEWVEKLNSDEKKYGGSGHLIGKVKADKVKSHDYPYSLTLTLAPLSVMVFEPVK